MEPILLAKSFFYVGFEGAEGATMHGGLYADTEGIYLFHKKHVWNPGIFGDPRLTLGLGSTIHRLCTKNRPIEYPFETSEIQSLPTDISSRFDLKKAKSNTLVSVIPKKQINMVGKETLGGYTVISVGPIQVKFASLKSIKKLQGLGYDCDKL